VAQNMRCVRFSLNEGQFRLATALCFVSRYCTPSELSFGKDDFAVSVPRLLEPGLQSNYCLLWSAVCLPLPMQCTRAPFPSATSSQRRPVISESASQFEQH